MIARFEVLNRRSQVLCDVVHQRIELLCLQRGGGLSYWVTHSGQTEIFCHQSGAC